MAAVMASVIVVAAVLLLGVRRSWARGPVAEAERAVAAGEPELAAAVTRAAAEPAALATAAAVGPGPGADRAPDAGSDAVPCPG